MKVTEFAIGIALRRGRVGLPITFGAVNNKPEDVHDNSQCDLRNCSAIPCAADFFGWPAIIGGWTVPMWLSWIGLVVAEGLSYFGISLAMRS